MLLDEIAARLVAQGVGVIGTSIFISAKAVIPTGAGPYLTILETGGLAPVRVQNASAARVRPSVQVVVRAATYQAARTMSTAAYAALDGLFNATLTGTFYLKITARQEPTDVGLDALDRPQLVFNVDVEKKP